MAMHLYYGHKNPYGFTQTNYTWSKLQSLLGLENHDIEFKKLKHDIYSLVRSRYLIVDAPNSDRAFKIMCEMERELQARHTDLFRGKHGERCLFLTLGILRRYCIVRGCSHPTERAVPLAYKTTDLGRKDGRDSGDTLSDSSTANKGSSHHPASLVNGIGRKRMRPFVLLNKRKKQKKSSQKSNQSSGVPPRSESVQSGAFFLAGPSSVSPVSSSGTPNVFRIGASSIGVSREGASSKPHYAVAGSSTKPIDQMPHVMNRNNTPAYHPDLMQLDIDNFYRMTPERNNSIDNPFDVERHHDPMSSRQLSSSSASSTPNKSLPTQGFPRHVASFRKNTSSFQSTPRTTNSDSGVVQRTKESGIAGIHRFLSKCNPPMMHYIHRFVKFGCTTTEYLQGVSRWSPEQRYKVLLKILQPAPGEMVPEMDIAILENQFETYFVDDDG